MKSKKIISAVLTGALAVTALFGLTACGEKDPPHTHAYSEHTFYCIKTEEQQEKVYSFKVCGCGEHKDETLVTNAIIADTENAGAIVRGTQNPEYELVDKVVVFKKGTYAEAIVGGTKNYHNVVFAGEYTGTNKEVVFEAGSYIYSQGSCSINGLEYNNISFKNRLFLGSQKNDIKNVSINNCTFKNEATDVGSNPAILVAPRDASDANSVIVQSENIAVENCSIDNFYQGIMIYHNKNAVIKNNVIKNTIHNAIAFQLNSGYTNKITGTITISNNKISDTYGIAPDAGLGERAIRFGQIKDATILVSNNDFTNAFDKDNEVLKASGIEDDVITSTITFTNNTNAGVKINDKTLTAQSTSFAITV